MQSHVQLPRQSSHTHKPHVHRTTALERSLVHFRHRPSHITCYILSYHYISPNYQLKHRSYHSVRIRLPRQHSSSEQHLPHCLVSCLHWRILMLPLNIHLFIEGYRRYVRVTFAVGRVRVYPHYTKTTNTHLRMSQISPLLFSLTHPPARPLCLSLSRPPPPFPPIPAPLHT